MKAVPLAVAIVIALACQDAPTAPARIHGVQKGNATLLAPTITPGVSAGWNHTCALRIDGTAVCWGDNSWGESAVPAGLAPLAQVSSGNNYTCGLKTDATVVCWGLYEPFAMSPVPAGLNSVAQISSGGTHVCALRTDGTVVCWGIPDHGYADPTPPPGLIATQVSAGQDHSCAVKADATVVCWGDNSDGQLAVPADLNSVSQIDAGFNQSCALRVDGTVLCWGDLTGGFGDPGGVTDLPAGLNSVAQVNTDFLHGCVTRRDASVVCWGYGPYGADVPAAATPAVQVSTGDYESCSLKTDGSVVCWGSDSYGNLDVPACLNLYTAICTPSIGPIAAPVAPVQVNTTITATATFTEPGSLTHVAVIDWGDGTSSAASVNEASGSASGGHSYASAGVYTVTLTLTDAYGGVGHSVFQYVVVYDQAAGFVTGGGWISSPSGAYVSNTSLVGRANFGFVSRYQKGATVPTGNTQFQFQAADFNFKSTSYDWLVISGPQAKYKGSGTINGSGDYGFLLSAVDGSVSGGGGIDKFRIKIWDKSTGAVVYDNQTGAADDATPVTSIQGGDIMIHN